MRAIGNFVWFILGGFIMGVSWWLLGLLAFVTVIGIWWGKACFVIGQFTFLPFGKEAISRRELTGKDDIGTGILGTLGNVVWFVFAGVWLAIGHLLYCHLLCHAYWNSLWYSAPQVSRYRCFPDWSDNRYE